MERSLREDARAIFEAAVRRVDPQAMVRQCLRIDDDTLRIRTETESLDIPFASFDRIVVTGAGKASGRMAATVEELLGSRLEAGVVAIKPGHGEAVERIQLIEAGHPVPDEGSLNAADRILHIAEEAGERTLVLNLISGGGSALLTRPHADDTVTVSLADLQATTSALLGCGATIQEINTVRKHLSAIKGGRLAQAFAPATVVSLILSDVVGDDLSSIASGLTVPDPTTFADARAVLERRGILETVPDSVRIVLERGVNGDIPETPKPGSAVFQAVHNVLIGTNAQALSSAREAAVDLGYRTLVLSSQVTGEAREVARVFVGLAADIRRLATQGIAPVDPPACIITGGETTVTLHGSGLGGRNQEMALAFLGEFWNRPEALSNVLFLSAGTDGNDGPTDAAGGFADREALCTALERIRAGTKVGSVSAGPGGEAATVVSAPAVATVAGRSATEPTSSVGRTSARATAAEALSENDSYRFLDEIGALLKTGPTNTNVCDVQVLLVRPV